MTTRSETAPKPKLGRVILGFVLAPIVGALAFVLGIVMYIGGPTDPSISLSNKFLIIIFYFLMGWIPAVICTVILGVPIYMLLRRRVRPTPSAVVLVGGLLGFALGSFTLLLFFFYPSYDISLTLERISADEVVAFLPLFPLFFACGLLGGLAFWLCAVWRDPRLTNTTSP